MCRIVVLVDIAPRAVDHGLHAEGQIAQCAADKGWIARSLATRPYRAARDRSTLFQRAVEPPSMIRSDPVTSQGQQSPSTRADAFETDRLHVGFG